MVYPYQPGWQGQPQVQAGQLKGRPVTSIEEVRGSSIEFDGSIFYFPDLANQRIYTKQINIDGTSTINMYEKKPIPQPQVVSSDQYITREEFETALKNLQQQLMVSAAAPVQSAQQQAVQAPQTSAPAREYKI